MPHPGKEANGVCPSKEAKNRTQCVSGRNSINSVLAKVKNNNKVLDKNANFNSKLLKKLILIPFFCNAS